MLASHLLAAPLQPVPPRWVARLAATNQFRCLTAQIPSATALDEHALAAAVDAAYATLARDLRAGHAHAVRIWNFVPSIQQSLGLGDRYMAFNAGRFNAYANWYGADAFSAALPTASAVGVCDDVLSVHVLANMTPGVPVNNPRQVAPYCYSERYGFRPPCFARATRVGSALLIGGTASILGEDSRHLDDIEAQTRETLANLAAVIESASPGCQRRALAKLRDLRIHVLHARDATRVSAIVRELVPHLTDVELVQAELCRKELLVEIEGRAVLAP